MITIKEIARLAGVSAKTAERALSGATKDKRRDARERAEKVRQIAAAHGYRPSELALALRRGSVRTIGFLSDILTDQYLAAAVETAMDEAGKAGFKVALRVARFDREQTAEAMKEFLASRMDGIITSCVSRQLPEELCRNLEKQHYPLFTLCGRSDYDFSSHAPDYSDALPRAVKCLADRGHKQVTLCLFDGKEYDNKINEKIFSDSCRQWGVEADFRIHNSRNQAGKLAEEKLPAVILYGKYSMRIYLDRCAELEFHPDVIGIYNEWTLAAAQTFQLRGIIFEQGENAVREAVRHILSRLSGGNVEHIALPARFVPETEMHSLKVADLANQMLFDRQ